MNRKDVGLLVLILVVGAVVAIINPRFLSPINVSNTANLVGLFGIFALGQAFVIISGGIELSVGSIIALLGVVFIDLVASEAVNPGIAFVIVVAIGCLIGLLHGFLVAKLGLQPFVVTLCGLLIYRGIARYYTEDATAGFPFGASFPTLEWLTAGRFYGIPHSLIAFIVITLVMGVVLGTVLLQVLQNLVNLLGIPSSLNFAVMGSVILIGVLADQQISRRTARVKAPAT
jgi:ribose transport system permease protein